MSCRFIGIVKVPTGNFLICFEVNSRIKAICCNSIEKLMETVLTDDEYDQWIDNGKLPLIDGKYTYDEASQRYEDAITRKTRARAWQTKKHIKYDTSLLMHHSSLLGAFAKLELDNDVDYHAFHEFEHEVNRVLKVLPSGQNKPVLRLRRLGNYHAMGMYVPIVNNIVIDFRGPEDSEIFMPTAGFHSFIHEYGHYLDYQSQNYQISLQSEFANIVNRYREHVINGDVTLDKIEYYCTPTEIFARCFERYMDDAGLQTDLLDKHSTYKTSPEYQAIDNQMMEDATKIFDRLFPEIRCHLENIQN